MPGKTAAIFTNHKWSVTVWLLACSEIPVSSKCSAKIVAQVKQSLWRQQKCNTLKSEWQEESQKSAVADKLGRRKTDLGLSERLFVGQGQAKRTKSRHHWKKLHCARLWMSAQLLFVRCGKQHIPCFQSQCSHHNKERLSRSSLVVMTESASVVSLVVTTIDPRNENTSTQFPWMDLNVDFSTVGVLLCRSHIKTTTGS